MNPHWVKGKFKGSSHSLKASNFFIRSSVGWNRWNFLGLVVPQSQSRFIPNVVNDESRRKPPSTFRAMGKLNVLQQVGCEYTGDRITSEGSFVAPDPTYHAIGAYSA